MVEIKEKNCFVCNKTKLIECFYKHSKMKDGHLNKCIECTKKGIRNRESELKDDPIWVEKEKKRNRDKYHRLNYRGVYKPSTERKKEIIKAYHQRFPEKALARKYTEIYLTKDSDYNLHHWSYNQEDWLDVIQLSIADHHFLHRYIIYDQERMMYRTINGELLDTKEKHLNYHEECKIKYLPF
jgi:hypothetical protein